MSIHEEIQAERARQVQLWGIQKIPSVVSCPLISNTTFYALPKEYEAKGRCDIAIKTGTVTYAHIAVEELCEAIDAPDDATRRGELIQLAAVVESWIEIIDGRLGAPK